MQAKRVQSMETFDYTPSSAVAAGDVVVQDNLVGFAPLPISAGVLGALQGSGIFSMVKANEQIAVGAAVYWDADGNPYGGVAGTGCATTTSTSNTFIGFAIATAGATATRVNVLCNAANVVTATTHETMSAVIADPGNAGAIPVTNSGYCPIVTAGAETRTLAAPTFAGQQLAICMKTDGGDCVITCATGISATQTTITLNDAGDAVFLVAIYSGTDLRWRIMGNSGAALG